MKALIPICGSVFALSIAAIVLGRLRHQSAWFYGGIAGLVAVAILAVAWFLKRRKQKAPAAPVERSPNLDLIRKQMVGAVERLRTTRGGRAGRTTLDDLPWYLMLGSTGSGKTTLLHESGVRPPYVAGDTDLREIRQRGLGGTKTVDPFIFERAVVLDTTGRYLNDTDAKEWLGFLDLLAECCADKEISGVVVTTSARELLTTDNDGVTTHAERIRFRIDQLVHRLGRAPAVYLVISQCDALVGFEEFFGGLTRAQRAGVWGATLDPESGKVRPRQAFDDESTLLVSILRSNLLDRLAQIEQPATAARAFGWPGQFEILCARVSRVVDVIFGRTHHETPLFRGVYFTSAAQTGPRLDAYSTELATRFGYTAPASDESREVAASSVAYFVEKFLTDVLFEDRLATQSKGAHERARAALKRAMAMSGAALAGILLWIGSAHVLTGGLVRRAGENIRATRSIVTSGPAQFDAGDLRTIDALCKDVEKLERRDGFWFQLLNLGTYGGGPTFEGRQALAGAVQPILVQPALQPLCDSLRAGPDFHTRKRLELPLEVVPKLGTGVDISPLVDRLTAHWSREWMQRAPAATTSEEQIAGVVDYAQHHMGVIRSVCDVETKSPGPSRATYNRMVAAANHVPAVTIESLIGPGTGLVSTTTVPGAYTRKGWDGPIRNYVLGVDEATRAELVPQYAREYQRHWFEFLDAVNCRVSASQRKQFLIAPKESAVARLIRAVDREVHLADSSETRIAEVGAGFGLVRDLAGEGAQDYVQQLQSLVPAATAVLCVETVDNFSTWVSAKVNGANSRDGSHVGRLLKFPAEVARPMAEPCPDAAAATESGGSGQGQNSNQTQAQNQVQGQGQSQGQVRKVNQLGPLVEFVILAPKQPSIDGQPCPKKPSGRYFAKLRQGQKYRFSVEGKCEFDGEVPPGCKGVIRLSCDDNAATCDD